MAEERLQKILAQAGIASRRKAEQLIVEGRVTVNGEVLKELGSKADPETDAIKVDGTLIRLPKRHVYIALNKPREVVTTVSDPQGRQTVMHLLKGVKERVFPVGRLDYHSEGLLLLTTDGEFANRITSPAGHVEKVYVVKANGFLSEDQLAGFEAGVPLSGRRTAPAKIKLIKKTVNPWYEVRLMEGRQNQIRIMFTHFHRLVEKLRRVKIGFLTLGGLPPGMWRYLSPEEVEHFQKLIGRSEAEAERRSKKPVPAGEEGQVEVARTEYPVLPKERFRRPRFQQPDAPGAHAELRGGDRPVTRRPAASRPVVEPPAAQEPKVERPGLERPEADRPATKRPGSRSFDGPKSDRPAFRRPSSDRPDSDRPASKRPSSRSFDGPKADRPSFQRSPSDRPASKRAGSRSFDGPKSDRPSFKRSPSDRPDSRRPDSRSFDGPKTDRSASKRPGSRPYDGPKSDRPSFKRSPSDRPDSRRPDSRSFDGPKTDRSASKRPGSRPYDGPKSDRPSFQRPPSDRPASKRPGSRPFDGPRSDRPSSDRPPSRGPGSRPYGGPRSGGPRSEGPATRGPGSRPPSGPKSDRSGSRKPPSRKPGPRRRDDR
jgi:23S rRNA pseudouridine2605 synthase